MTPTKGKAEKTKMVVAHLYIWIDKEGEEHGDLSRCILDNPEVHQDHVQGFDAIGLVPKEALD